MDPLETAVAVNHPLGIVAGATFYFSPESAKRAEGIGIDVASLYAAGRGAVLGDVTPQEVDRTFTFFAPGLIAGLVAGARALADPADILAAHLGAADDFALAEFGTVDVGTLEAFDRAAGVMVASLPTGRWPLVDGYRAAAVPTGTVPAAFRQAVLLRELRGGVHREAILGAGIAPSAACQFDRGDDYFRLHGYGDRDRVADTPAIRAALAAAGARADEEMAGYLDPLDGAGREALAAGARAMLTALGDPAAVS